MNAVNDGMRHGPAAAGRSMTDIDGAARANVGGLSMIALSRAQWAEAMVTDYHQRRQQQLPPRLLSSVNGNVLALYYRDSALRNAIDEMDALDVDGKPLVLASRWFAETRLPERVATTDFFHDAAKAAESNDLSFYFLGAEAEVSQRAVDKVRGDYPNLRIAGARDGFFKEHEIPQILDDIRAAGTDVLWVGMGVPREQQFVAEHGRKLMGLTWVKSCGGLFNFLAGAYSRAPKWMQDAGLEWAYRAASEPGRLGRRYLSTNFAAAYHILAAATSRATPVPSERAS